MKLPELNELSSSRSIIDAFGGYNHNLRISDGEFYDMWNLTSSYYPVLAPRKARGVYSEPNHKPLALIEKDALCYVYREGENKLHFVMNEEDCDVGITTVESDEERTLISMGAYVIIMPDKMYFNTKDHSDKGNIEAKWESNGNKVTFRLCKADGEEYDIDIIGDDEPKDTEENPITNGYLWLDTSSSPSSLKMYSAANGMWSSVATTYIKIKADGIGAAFNEYDGVTISGVTVDGLTDLNNTMVIYAKGDDYITVVGILDNPAGEEQTDEIKVERWMPTMDYIIESNNRLWGCHYGVNRKGEVVNELYSCKLGDFKNWNCFMGTSQDSYYVSLGTDGQFTGAYTYLGHPTFFKENCLHTVYGSYPAEYQVQDTACRGVQRDSSKSLAMVNETLYYKSRTGICAYSGALPTEISSVMGEKSYSNAVACSHKGKYYISMKDVSSGEYVLFVCDTEKGMWHKEDNLHVKDFCPIDEEIYYIEETGTEEDKVAIKTIFGSGTTDTTPISWMAESGVIGFSSPDKKYISRLSMRLSIDIGAKVGISIQYDSSGVWEKVCAITGHSLRTFTLPIRPKRCDHFKLLIEGVGNVKIYSITKTTEEGSDV